MPILHPAPVILTRTATHFAIAVAILALDLATGPYFQFPILFVIPVSLAAWYGSRASALGLACMLPLARLWIAIAVEQPYPAVYSAVNAGIRILVLAFIAHLAATTARQAQSLRERLEGLVTVCAWSRTVEYQGEWLSFEAYLKRRWNLDTTHGISPKELERLVVDENGGQLSGRLP